jgi:hypothetical protein
MVLNSEILSLQNVAELIEVWKPAPEFDNYEISNIGSVRNIKTGKLRTPTIDRTIGYLKVHLFNESGLKSFLIHRLVATLFVENPNQLPLVDHKNRDKTDNRASNLRFVSHADNTKSAAESGVMGRKGSVRKVEQLLDGKVIAIHKNGGVPGFDSRRINDCCHGKKKSYKGYGWRFAA